MWRFAWLAWVVGCGGDQEPKDPVDPTGDLDGDGFDASEDCDDDDDAIRPGAVDAPYDGVDQDCADGDLIDVDLDGFDAVQVGGDDCDDLDPTVFPGAEDVPYDDVDQDCADGDKVDLDGDGFGADDCDDDDPEVFPGAADAAYDGIDQDCAEDCDYDADHDGAVPPEWIGAVTDGSVCDRDPSGEVGVRSDCDDTYSGASTQALVGSTPADGSIGWDGFEPLEIRFRDREEDIQMALYDADGVQVPTSSFPVVQGTWQLVAYHPITGFVYPLRADTTYRLEIQHSCGHETIGFTTGDGLGPVVPDDLVDRVWRLEPSAMAWNGFAVVEYLSMDTFGLLSVTATDGDTVDLRWAVPDRSGAQDLCVPTVDAVGVDFSTNPFLAAGFDYPVAVAGGGDVHTFPHLEGRLEATFYADAVYSAVLAGTVETHAVTTLVGAPADEACTNYGCVPCPDGSGPTCLAETLMLEGLFEASGPPLVPRTADEIALDPACP